MLGVLSIRLVRINSLGVLPALQQFALLMFSHASLRAYNYDSLVLKYKRRAFSKLSSNPSLVMKAGLSDFKGELSQVRLDRAEDY